MPGSHELFHRYFASAGQGKICASDMHEIFAPATSSTHRPVKIQRATKQRQTAVMAGQ